MIPFGYKAGFWRVSEHPRLMGDVNGDGKVDIVGFTIAGVVSLGTNEGIFSTLKHVLASYVSNAGWRVSPYPRLSRDLNFDEKVDIVGFRNAVVYISLGTNEGTFSTPRHVLSSYGPNAGWRVKQHS